MQILLLLSVFVVATCGLVYELIAGALASYLLGDSVLQFSTVIGCYLFAMGVGSYLSKFARGNLLLLFVQVEILIGLVGGGSAALLFLVFEYAASFQVVLYLLVFITGTLVGLEIPLLMRILRDRLEFSDLVSKVLSFDYIGALVASVCFPLLFVPYLGLVKTAFFFGLLNVAVALWLAVSYGRDAAFRPLRVFAVIALGALLLGFVYADHLVSVAEAAMYPDKIIYAQQTPYQRMVVTSRNDDLRLYLNGNLQFSSRDEYRYHEALVHVGLASLPAAKRVLILGGGDGLAAREVLRYPNIENVTLVDLDAAMTTLFRDSDLFARLNAGSLRDPRVRVVNADAFLWAQEQQERFDFVIVDFPDPTNYSIGKLYTTTFYRAVLNLLSPGALVVVQSTSPLLARRSFWCVAATLEAVGFTVRPYHAIVPSFGEWGFVLAGREGAAPISRLPAGLRFVSPTSVGALFDFPPDMERIDAEPNRLTNQALVEYYQHEWASYS